MNENARDQEIKEQIRRQVARAGRQLVGYRVFLFGSRACGMARPRSDFDVGVMGPAPLPPAVFQQIEDWLDEIDTLYRIDWVDMNRVTAAFRAEAMRQTDNRSTLKGLCNQAR